MQGDDRRDSLSEIRETAAGGVEPDGSRRSIIAQKHAANITDPLSRTIVLDGIGQAMSKSREDKSLLINLYNGALSQLENEWSTEGVAKAFLIVSRAFQPLDPDRALYSIKSAILVLNRMVERRSQGSDTMGAGTTADVFADHGLRAMSRLGVCSSLLAESDRVEPDGSRRSIASDQESQKCLLINRRKTGGCHGN